MTERAIDAVLWDFGGIFTLSPFDNMTGYAEELGSDPGTLAHLLFGYDEPDGDHPWHRLERGEMALPDALGAVTNIAHDAGMPDFDMYRFLSSLAGGTGSSRDHVVDLVAELADAGLAQGIVTNNIAEFGPAWRQLIPIDSFDFVVDSSEVGVRKPDPAIFAIALERLGGPPAARVAFLDDHIVNAAAAADLGMRAVLVRNDPDPALAELCRLAGVDDPAAADPKRR